MALVGVELHLAVRQGADRLAVFADVGDQHHCRMLRADELRRVDFRRRAEALGEADLIVLGQRLVAQQDDQMLVPGTEDLLKTRIVEGLAQIDADNLRAEGLRQR